MYRVEKDSVGEAYIPEKDYYGVHAFRARHNFQISGSLLDSDFIISLAEIKKACALANMELGELELKKGEAIVLACDEVINGKFHEHFIVDPMQGGAGTSSNMNADEVIANRAIEYLGGKLGDYQVIHPNDDVNLGQSTNDVYPTAGKLTMLKKVPALLAELERMEIALFEKSEQFKNIKKLGRTQLQDAVPLTLGQEFHAYYSAIKRNRRRIQLASQEMLLVNLGGTAIGTSINAHPKFPALAVNHLCQITGLNLELTADLIDGTQNIDSYAVLSDSLKVLAISLSKVANDIRLLSSGPRSGIGEIKIPAKQNGSSIMPGKINPVIPEIVNQCAFAVVGNNVTISMAVEAGQLELNAFEPVIFYRLIESFNLLSKGIHTFVENCIVDIEADEERCSELLEQSTFLATELSSTIGYAQAAEIAKSALNTGESVRQVAISSGVDQTILNNLAY